MAGRPEFVQKKAGLESRSIHLLVNHAWVLSFRAVTYAGLGHFADRRDTLVLH
jgi:hypothetical protein